MTKKKVTTPVEETTPTETPVVETVVTEEVNTTTKVEVTTDVVEKPEPENKPEVVKDSNSKIKAGVITVTKKEAQSDEFRKYGIRSKGIWRIREKKDGFRVEHLST